MKLALALATALVAIAPASAAFAQTSEMSQFYAPGSANEPMHPDHDKGRVVRTLERNHISSREAASDTSGR